MVQKLLFLNRDSKLTKLLADSLAGNGVTLMVSKINHDSSYMAMLVIIVKTMMMNVLSPLIELTYCFAEL